MPVMVEAFERAVNFGWSSIEILYTRIGFPIGGRG
jgi:hypothetical protein